jgi:hypothetical protein
MAFSAPLPAGLATRGWKAKIRDRERNEPPHVTILHRTRAWRLDLRTWRFLDKEPDPNDVPEELLSELIRQSALLRKKWDEMYPENPIESKEESDD